jgi:hypothetical protein
MALLVTGGLGYRLARLRSACCGRTAAPRRRNLANSVGSVLERIRELAPDATIGDSSGRDTCDRVALDSLFREHPSMRCSISQSSGGRRIGRKPGNTRTTM